MIRGAACAAGRADERRPGQPERADEDRPPAEDGCVGQRLVRQRCRHPGSWLVQRPRGSEGRARDPTAATTAVRGILGATGPARGPQRAPEPGTAAAWLPRLDSNQ